MKKLSPAPDFTIRDEYAIMHLLLSGDLSIQAGARSAMAVENDIVLIYLENSPLAFARIETIEPDIKRGWYHVKFLLLQIPLQVVTWILRDAYIDGEIFTMGGKEMRIEKVECPEDPKQTDQDFSEKREDQAAPDNKNNVITLADLKKK